MQKVEGSNPFSRFPLQLPVLVEQGEGSWVWLDHGPECWYFL
jgi:hypothetical protein